MFKRKELEEIFNQKINNYSDTTIESKIIFNI